MMLGGAVLAQAGVKIQFGWLSRAQQRRIGQVAIEWLSCGSADRTINHSSAPSLCLRDAREGVRGGGQRAERAAHLPLTPARVGPRWSQIDAIFRINCRLALNRTHALLSDALA
jgi:hypothetical protein